MKDDGVTLKIDWKGAREIRVEPVNVTPGAGGRGSDRVVGWTCTPTIESRPESAEVQQIVRFAMPVSTAAVLAKSLTDALAARKKATSVAAETAEHDETGPQGRKGADEAATRGEGNAAAEGDDGHGRS